MKRSQDYLNVMRKIQKEPKFSQRKMAKSLGYSLGKLNYCIKALQEKGLVKIQNFKNQNNKIEYIQYVLTPRGISFRTKLTVDFMKRKMEEFDELKKEIEKGE